MFRHILAPLDGSAMADRILTQVAAIAQINSSPITLLRVLKTDGAEASAVDPLAWYFAKAEAQAYLDEATQRLARLGLASNTVLLEGGITQRILEYLDKQNVDLLVLSSQAQGGDSGWNISSVAQKITQRVGTSIMLVRSSAETNEVQGGLEAEITQYRRILAPLDGSQRAESTLPLASALAERYSADLLVVYVATRPEMIQRVPLSAQDAELADNVVARNRVEAEKYFAQLRSRLPAKTQTHILSDDSLSRALHGFVEQEQVDLVVLSAHGHTCQSRWPYSALVNSFITYGETSLLILQDLPDNRTRRARVEYVTEALTMPTRRANEEEGLNVRAHFEI